ncbi:MAG: ribosome-recycling factor, partial [Chloroflexi bacterium]
QGNKDLEELESEKLITEDQHKRGKELLDELTKKYAAEADALGKKKEQEVMEV